MSFVLDENNALNFPRSDFSDAVVSRISQLEKLSIGVRPYAVRRIDGGNSALVTANQWLGDQTHIATELAGRAMILVEHDRVQLQSGDQIGLSIDAEDLHFFDADTGQSIAHGGDLA